MESETTATRNESILAARAVDFGYDDRPVLSGIDLALRAGEIAALLGPNGSGKTTILKVLCGILTPQAGHVLCDGHPFDTFRRRDLARRLALVPQELNVPFAFTVQEIVGLGRTPHARAFLGESSRDREAVAAALDMTETRELAGRLFGELSGGEQQRVVIAMALAQIASPGDGRPVLLLDEPTVHLDINHQVEVLELIAKLNRERGLTVLATMHDLNLASLYFDRLILLSAGTIVAEGAPRDVLSEERVASVFGAHVMVQPHPTQRHVPNVVLLPSQATGAGKD